MWLSSKKQKRSWTTGAARSTVSSMMFSSLSGQTEKLDLIISLYFLFCDKAVSPNYRRLPAVKNVHSGSRSSVSLLLSLSSVVDRGLATISQARTLLSEFNIQHKGNWNHQCKQFKWNNIYVLCQLEVQCPAGTLQQLPPFFACVATLNNPPGMDEHGKTHRSVDMCGFNAQLRKAHTLHKPQNRVSKVEVYGLFRDWKEF